jgi:hypothetical protein
MSPKLPDVEKLAKASKKAARMQVLDTCCDVIALAKVNNNGRLPHQFWDKMMARLHTDPTLQSITRNVLQSHGLRRDLKKTESIETPATPIATPAQAAATTMATDNPIATPAQAAATPMPTDTPKERNKGGRPKGTTHANAQALAVKVVRATNIAASEYHALRLQRKQDATNSNSLPKGALTNIIVAAKLEVGLPANIEIKLNTIRRRIERGTIEPIVARGGLVTPMMSVEPTLVMFCKKMSSAGRPLGKQEFLSLANSLIKGSPVEQEVIRFKAKYCGGDPNSESADLSDSYFKFFMKRNKHLIDNKE